MADNKRKDGVKNQLKKMNRKMDILEQGQRKIIHQLKYDKRHYKDKTNLATKVKLPMMHPTTVTGSVTSDSCLSGYEHLHKDVLRENIVLMTNRMHLKKDLVLDELIAENCLSEDEVACIRDKYNRKDQTRKLISLMSNRSHTNFTKFVKIISKNENYPDIGNKLKEELEVKEREESRQKECIPCVIMRDVNIKDIIDTLYASRLIDLNSLEFLSDCNLYDKRDADEVWRGIFTNIRNSSEKINIENFKKSLQEKYYYLSKKLINSSSLYCRCAKGIFEKDNTTLSCTESNDEFSTTSTRCETKDASSTISGQSEELDSRVTGAPNKHRRTAKWVNDTQSLANLDRPKLVITPARSEINQVQMMPTTVDFEFMTNSGEMKLHMDSLVQMKKSNSDFAKPPTKNRPTVSNRVQTKQRNATSREYSVENGSEEEMSETKKVTQASYHYIQPLPDNRSKVNQMEIMQTTADFNKYPGEMMSHIDSSVQIKNSNSDFTKPSTKNRPMVFLVNSKQRSAQSKEISKENEYEFLRPSTENRPKAFNGVQAKQSSATSTEYSTENGFKDHCSKNKKVTQSTDHSIKPLSDNRSKVDQLEIMQTTAGFNKHPGETKSHIDSSVHEQNGNFAVKKPPTDRVKSIVQMFDDCSANGTKPVIVERAFVKRNGRNANSIEISKENESEVLPPSIENRPNVSNCVQTKQISATSIEYSMDNGSEDHCSENKQVTPATDHSIQPLSDTRSKVNQVEITQTSAGFNKHPGEMKSHIDKLVQMTKSNSDFTNPPTENRPKVSYRVQTKQNSATLTECSMENCPEDLCSKNKKVTQSNDHSIKPICDNRSKVEQLETMQKTAGFNKHPGETKSHIDSSVQMMNGNSVVTKPSTDMLNSEKFADKKPMKSVKAFRGMNCKDIKLNEIPKENESEVLPPSIENRPNISNCVQTKQTSATSKEYSKGYASEDHCSENKNVTQASDYSMQLLPNNKSKVNQVKKTQTTGGFNNNPGDKNTSIKTSKENWSEVFCSEKNRFLHTERSHPEFKKPPANKEEKVNSPVETNGGSVKNSEVMRSSIATDKKSKVSMKTEPRNVSKTRGPVQSNHARNLTTITNTACSEKSDISLKRKQVSSSAEIKAQWPVKIARTFFGYGYLWGKK